MKRVLPLFFLFVFVSVLLLPVGAAAKEEGLAGGCKAAYLCDQYSGDAAYERNAEARLPIASMCKIMTLLLCFEAEESGAFSFEDKICVSERASSMGGSQVFLEAGGEYAAGDLIKSICIASANDSCVAMAEKIAGSEELFVKKMNERARELGMENTVFSNCTGLPKEGQYSCAKDVAKMLCRLLCHEKYYDYSRIWLDEMEHTGGRKTEMANTNKLIRNYSGCDAGKTGYTSEAGFCLAASAKRGNMRIVSVVIGAGDSKTRFRGVSEMFDYAFANYESRCVVDGKVCDDLIVCVTGGKKKEVAVRPERPVYLFCKKGSEENVTVDAEVYDLKAPVDGGDVAGALTVYRNGVEAESVALLANDSVARANYFDSLRDIADNWCIV